MGGWVLRESRWICWWYEQASTGSSSSHLGSRCRYSLLKWPLKQPGPYGFTHTCTPEPVPGPMPGTTKAWIYTRNNGGSMPKLPPEAGHMSRRMPRAYSRTHTRAVLTPEPTPAQLSNRYYASTNPTPRPTPSLDQRLDRIDCPCSQSPTSPGPTYSPVHCWTTTRTDWPT